MGILVNAGFDVGSSTPIDSRTFKETIDERDALVTDGCVYEGMEVYCKDTQTEYKWTGTDWEEVGTGGGSISELASDIAYDNTALADVDNVAEALDTIVSEVDELFQSVSDGKKAFANAITRKGVSTAATATFATMATNISKIPYLNLKSETKSVTTTSTYQTVTLSFSSTVYGIISITGSTTGLRLRPDSSGMIAKVSGNTVTLRTQGLGTFTVTARVKA